MNDQIYVNMNCSGTLYKNVQSEIQTNILTAEDPQSGVQVNIVFHRLNQFERGTMDGLTTEFQGHLRRIFNQTKGSSIGIIRIFECVKIDTALQTDINLISALTSSISETFSAETEVAFLEVQYSSSSSSVFDSRSHIVDVQPLFSYNKMLEAFADLSELMEQNGLELDIEAILRDHPQLFETKQISIDQL